jgi:carboxylesterase
MRPGRAYAGAMTTSGIRRQQPGILRPAPERPARSPSADPVRPGAEPYVGGDGHIGVLLCHGFTGSPAAMRPWAEHLADSGFRVRVPRLPGHGTRWRELNRTGWQDWYATVERELLRLCDETSVVFVGGLSMGGALALRLAERQHRHRIAGLCLVNPAITHSDPRLMLLPVLKRLAPSMGAISGDIAKPGADEIAYDRTPLRALASQVELWDQVIGDLGRIRLPLLVFRSAHDHVIGPASVRMIAERTNSRPLTQRSLPRSFHVATLDYDAEQIFSESADFFTRVAADQPATR